MAADRLPSIHPGDVIREDFLKPLGRSAYWLAKGLRVPPTRVADILARRRAVTADTAMRLSRFLGCSPQFWMGLQAQYDLEVAERSRREDYAAIEPRDGLPAG